MPCINPMLRHKTFVHLFLNPKTLHLEAHTLSPKAKNQLLLQGPGCSHQRGPDLVAPEEVDLRSHTSDHAVSLPSLSPLHAPLPGLGRHITEQ